MIRSGFGRFSRLARCARGVSSVEVALVAPFLAFMVMGITDIARVGALKARYQQAAHRGLELAMVNSTQASSSSIQQQAATAAGVPTNQVTVTYSLECNGTATSYSSSCGSGQESARYIKVRVSGSYAPKFNMGPLGINYGGRSSNGTVPVSANAMIRIQ